jgi:hypothetical protein
MSDSQFNVRHFGADISIFRSVIRNLKLIILIKNVIRFNLIKLLLDIEGGPLIRTYGHLLILKSILG